MSTTYTVTADRAIGPPTLELSPPADVVTAFQVTYGPQQLQLTVSSSRAGVSLEAREPVALALPWLTDALAAELIARDLLLERDVQAWQATVTLPWHARAVERLGKVALDLPLMADLGGTTRIFRVRGKKILPAGLLRFRLVEDLALIMGRGGLAAPVGSLAGTGAVFGASGSVTAPVGALAGTGDVFAIEGEGAMTASVGTLDGTGTVTITTDSLLLETSDHLLLETGDRLLTE